MSDLAEPAIFARLGDVCSWRDPQAVLPFRRLVSDNRLGHHRLRAKARRGPNDAPRVRGRHPSASSISSSGPSFADALGIHGEILGDPDATVPIDVWYGFVEAHRRGQRRSVSRPPLRHREPPPVPRERRRDACSCFSLATPCESPSIACCGTSATGTKVRVTRSRNNGHLLVVRYRPWGPARPAHVQLAEKTVAQTLAFVRVVARRAGAARRVLPPRTAPGR